MADSSGWRSIADYLGGLSNSNALVKYLQMLPQAAQTAYQGAWAPLAQGYEAIDAVDQQQRAAHPTLAKVNDALGLFTAAGPSVGMIRAWHGTNAEPFSRFDPSRIGTVTDNGQLGAGFYLSTDKAVARGRKTALAADVDLKNPLHVAIDNWDANKSKIVNDAIGTTGLTGQELTDRLRSMGHDGVILDYSPLGYHHQEVVSFDPDLISIISNEPGPPPLR